MAPSPRSCYLNHCCMILILSVMILYQGLGVLAVAPSPRSCYFIHRYDFDSVSDDFASRAMSCLRWLLVPGAVISFIVV